MPHACDECMVQMGGGGSATVKSKNCNKGPLTFSSKAYSLLLTPRATLAPRTNLSLTPALYFVD